MRHFSSCCVLFIALTASGYAQAGDLAPPPPRVFGIPDPVFYNWGGPYFGLVLGTTLYGTAQTDAASGLGGSNGFTLRGGAVGGTLGANWQAGRFIFGVEADASYATFKGNGVALGDVTNVASINEKWFGTARLRAGGMPVDYLFVYLTGGVAAATVDASVDLSIAGVPNVFTASSSQLRTGWTAGTGVEGIIGRGVSVKVEYLYTQLDNPLYTFNPVAGIAVPSSHFAVKNHMLRIGTNLNWEAFR
jgi:outer membrane immunogenic protein